MGQLIWIFAAVAAVGGVIGLTSLNNQKPEIAKTEPGRVTEQVLQPEPQGFGSDGSALAVAAFGLSALQPATYNGEMVLEIIDASHLDEAEKGELTADLAAAEAGRADLKDVLEDVRIALALE
jgi:hypothetical protein